MCGIVGAVGRRNMVPVLLEGLRRLEYRGYDSAGVAVLGEDGALKRKRTAGKVSQLEALIEHDPLQGATGIAHTRWATHGVPSEANAHPHMTGDTVALVHNGIVENYAALRQQLEQAGYVFTSQTDTEVIVTKIHQEMQAGVGLREAVQRSITALQGTYAFGVISRDDPKRLVAARRGSPLVIGVGSGEQFIASDSLALLPVTRRVIYLEDGDVAEITPDEVAIYDALGRRVDRPVRETQVRADLVDKGEYKHFMLKEIFEQGRAVAQTLEGRISAHRVLEHAFGPRAPEVFDRTREIQIIACGTSYHAGMVARYWLEALAGMRCLVDVASEFRYRQPVINPDTLVVTISQSGETADTLAALRETKQRPNAGTLAICNVAESALVRESDLALMTHAGPEIGVASTKAFTTQLAALLLLVAVLGRRRGMPAGQEAALVEHLRGLPDKIEQVVALDQSIRQLAERLAEKEHVLFLGRGAHYPIAMEGALKLKEISYIHAEAYPAGELKHGPLALVDRNMPVIAVAPNNQLLEKLKSNLEEVRSRGGQLIVFADTQSDVELGEEATIIPVAAVDDLMAPIVFTIPLQLLAYHVAVIKGTDVDQPRNLAKSVTVE